MKSLIVIGLFLQLLSEEVQSAIYKPDGTWYREDGMARQIYSIPKGLKLITGKETYVYYRIGENLYRMNWTVGTDGGRYRWTLCVKSLTVIENTYENESKPGTIRYTYTRILE